MGFRVTGGAKSTQPGVVVLLFQVHRPLRLLLLRPQEEVCPPLSPACHPPQHPSVPLLVGSKVCRRRAERFRAVPELRGAHPDVPLLPAGSLRPLPEALPLVEEVPHHHPARAVCPRFLPRTAAAHLHLRLPSGCILDVPVTGVQYFILFMAFYRQAYSKKKSIVKVDKNGNSDLSNGEPTGNGQLANGHTVLLASNGGGTDLRQRKLA